MMKQHIVQVYLYLAASLQVAPELITLEFPSDHALGHVTMPNKRSDTEIDHTHLALISTAYSLPFTTVELMSGIEQQTEHRAVIKTNTHTP